MALEKVRQMLLSNENTHWWKWLLCIQIDASDDDRPWTCIDGILKKLPIIEVTII